MAAPPLDTELEGFASILQATGAVSLAFFLHRVSPDQMHQVASWGEPLPAGVSSALVSAASLSSGPHALAGSPPLWLQTVPLMEDGHKTGAVVLAYTQRCKPTFSPTFLRLVSALVACTWRNQALRKEISVHEDQEKAVAPSTSSAKKAKRTDTSHGPLTGDPK